RGRYGPPAVWQRRWTSACCRRPSGRTACRLPPQGTLLRGLRRVLAWARYTLGWTLGWTPADGTLPPLQSLGFGTSRWRLQGNATLRLRAGERGHHLFFLLHKSPLLARSGHARASARCPLGGKADIAR